MAVGSTDGDGVAVGSAGAEGVIRGSTEGDAGAEGSVDGDSAGKLTSALGLAEGVGVGASVGSVPGPGVPDGGGSDSKVRSPIANVLVRVKTSSDGIPIRTSKS